MDDDIHAQIQRPDFLNDPKLKETLQDPQTLAEEMRRIPGVTAASVRTQGFALMSKGETSFGAEIVGVQPGSERKFSTLPGMVKQGRYLAPGSVDGIVIGKLLARNLKAQVGDRLTLLGMALDGTIAAASFRVSGIFSTGMSELDRQLAEVPLPAFQSAFHMGDKANAVVLSAASLRRMARVLPRAKKIAAGRGLVVRKWDELEPGVKQAVELDAASSSLVYVALVVVVIFTILNTMLMAVLERTKEFGLMLSLGMRPGRIGLSLWIETLFLTVAGVGFGILLGWGATEYFVIHGLTFQGSETLFSRWGLPAVVHPAVSPLSLFSGPSVIALFVCIAGLYPAFRVRKLDPVAALRTEA